MGYIGGITAFSLGCINITSPEFWKPPPRNFEITSPKFENSSYTQILLYCDCTIIDYKYINLSILFIMGIFSNKGLKILIYKYTHDINLLCISPSALFEVSLSHSNPQLSPSKIFLLRDTHGPLAF